MLPHCSKPASIPDREGPTHAILCGAHRRRPGSRRLSIEAVPEAAVEITAVGEFWAEEQPIPMAVRRASPFAFAQEVASVGTTGASLRARATPLLRNRLVPALGRGRRAPRSEPLEARERATADLPSRAQADVGFLDLLCSLRCSHTNAPLGRRFPPDTCFIVRVMMKHGLPCCTVPWTMSPGGALARSSEMRLRRLDDSARATDNRPARNAREL